MVKSILKLWIPWVLGGVIGVIVLSFFLNGELGWGHIVVSSIYGLIGIVIGLRIKKIFTE